MLLWYSWRCTFSNVMVQNKLSKCLLWDRFMVKSWFLFSNSAFSAVYKILFTFWSTNTKLRDRVMNRETLYIWHCIREAITMFNQKGGIKENIALRCEKITMIRINLGSRMWFSIFSSLWTFFFCRRSF